MSSKTKSVQTPFQQEQKQTNTYEYTSPYGQEGTKELLDVPLDFGKPLDVDPGVARRSSLAEQGINNRYDSAFMSGIPSWIREINRNKELRDVQSQGAAEAQQAQYANQLGNNEITSQKTRAELERKRLLLPQLVQTGGLSSGSGYGTQVVQQPSFWGQLATGVASGLAGNPKI
jgi:hypothetical protein